MANREASFGLAQRGDPSDKRARASADATSLRFHARLRRPPSPSSLPGSLPVPFFGDVLTAKAASVGLNPSKQEYLDPSDRELTGDKRRFETLGSLGCHDRCSLNEEQCERAIAAMRAYFQRGKPVYGWFRPLARLMEAMGYSYQEGAVAHLDLVQEATDPTWSRLKGDRSAGATRQVPKSRWPSASRQSRIAPARTRAGAETTRPVGRTKPSHSRCARIAGSSLALAISSSPAGGGHAGLGPHPRRSPRYSWSSPTTSHRPFFVGPTWRIRPASRRRSRWYLIPSDVIPIRSASAFRVSVGSWRSSARICSWVVSWVVPPEASPLPRPRSARGRPRRTETRPRWRATRRGAEAPASPPRGRR
jgi:hypothetical protein